MNQRRWLRGPLLGLILAAPACVPLARVETTPSAIAAADSAVRVAMTREATIDPRQFSTATVGVTPFRVTAADTTLNVLGYGLADLLITDLARSGQLRVVDRLRVDALMRELALAGSGRVDSASAPRAGRLLGARRLVLGSLTADGRSPARLDGRVGDVVTGRIAATPPSRAPIEAILDAEKSLAFQLFDALGVRLTPAERALVEQRPTRSLAALLAYSRGVRAESVRDLRQARREYQSALGLDPAFATVRDRLGLVERWLADRGVAMGRTNPAGILATAGIGPAVIPALIGVTDPAFRQRLAATLIVILQLP
jgi:TolB-like protein